MKVTNDINGTDLVRVKVVRGKLKGVEGYVLSKDYYVDAIPMVGLFGLDGDYYVVQHKNIKPVEEEVE